MGLGWNISYEGLPSDYSLGHNMVAGAFAGIAVCGRMATLLVENLHREDQNADASPPGALGDVPCRSVEGLCCKHLETNSILVVAALSADRAKFSRPECKSSVPVPVASIQACQMRCQQFTE